MFCWTYVGSSNNNIPPITRSIACSKCFIEINFEECLAAISAASLQTLATSAPASQQLRLIGLRLIPEKRAQFILLLLYRRVFISHNRQSYKRKAIYGRNIPHSNAEQPNLPQETLLMSWDATQKHDTWLECERNPYHGELTFDKAKQVSGRILCIKIYEFLHQYGYGKNHWTRLWQDRMIKNRIDKAWSDWHIATV